MSIFSFFKKANNKNPKIGLALGSGSMKGLAHIGVIESLLDNNIPIDIICGSSMGAIIGGVYSSGMDIYELKNFVCSMKMMEYIDFSNPLNKGGFLSGDKIEKLIKNLTHNATFEQTQKEFYCVATDVNEGSLKVFEEGDLHKAIRASMSIPGIFKPTEIDGHVYVDGGVLRRVPSGVLKDKGADIILSVDVGYRGTTFEGKISPVEALNRSFDIMEWEIVKLENVNDIEITPDVRFVNSRFDTSNAEKIIEEGRKAAEEKMEEIKKAIEDFKRK